MCGARSVEDYADAVVEDLRRLVTVRSSPPPPSPPSSSTPSYRRSSSSEGGDEEAGEDVVRDGDHDDDDDDDAWPCVVLDRHMGPAELAAIFSRTAINVHVSGAEFVFVIFPPTPSRPDRAFFRTRQIWR